MSIPYDNIKKAIDDNSRTREEKRPKPLPNYFECLCPEDYADDGCGVTAEDPAATKPFTSGTTGKPPKKSELK